MSHHDGPSPEELRALEAEAGRARPRSTYADADLADESGERGKDYARRAARKAFDHATRRFLQARAPQGGPGPQAGAGSAGAGSAGAGSTGAAAAGAGAGAAGAATGAGAGIAAAGTGAGASAGSGAAAGVAVGAKALLIALVVVLVAVVVIAVVAVIIGALTTEAEAAQARAAAAVPAAYQPLIAAAAEQYQVPAPVLAAILKLESNFGAETGPSAAGATGPCQFLPSTWAAYGVDGDGDGAADPENPADCIPAMAAYLVAHGAHVDLPAAVYAYNQDETYVRDVLLLAIAYGLSPTAAGIPPGFFGAFIPPTVGGITTRFGVIDCHHATPHDGIDIAYPGGAEIWAAADGVVTHVEYNASDRGYGHNVIVDHGNGLATRYAHLAAIYVREGDAVRQGEAIGFMGDTGYSTGIHLHFMVYVHGVVADPMAFVPLLQTFPEWIGEC